MQLALGIRDREFKTPALNAARKTAILTLTEMQKRSPVAIDPRIHALLNQEKKSVFKLYYMLAQAQLRGRSDFIRSDGTVFITDDPGGRRWAQRVMGMSAGLSTRIGRQALQRLVELGLADSEVSRGRCTYVFVKGLQKLAGSIWWRIVVQGFSREKKMVARAKKASEKSVSPSDTFLPLPSGRRSLTSNIDGPASESRDKKEGIPADARMFLAQIKASRLNSD